MTSPLPSSRQPLGSIEGKLVFVNQVWQRWFNSFTASPQPIAPAVPAGSPFSAIVVSAGNYFVTGGTVSAITIQRGTTTINTGMTSGFFPVGNSDVFAVTYSVLPTIQFIPS